MSVTAERISYEDASAELKKDTAGMDREGEVDGNTRSGLSFFKSAGDFSSYHKDAQTRCTLCF